MTIVAAMFNNTFIVARRTRGADGQGGHLISYVVIGAVDGLIRPASSEERALAQQEQRRVTHVLYTAESEDIERGDQVTGAGLLVDVLGRRQPSGTGHALGITALDHACWDCEEHQQEVTEAVS